MKQQKFTRQFFADLAKEFNLNAGIIERLGNAHNHEIVVGGAELDLLIELQEKLKMLEVMGDDEFRRFYIEIPRPKPEEWGNCEECIEDGEYETKEKFYEDWQCWNPMESRWFHISSMKYRECRALRIMDRKYTWVMMTNESSYRDKRGASHTDYGYEKILTSIFSYLKKLVDAIISDPDGFNSYVSANLPYQQRDGRIARKELYRIVPRLRIEVEDRETALKALEDSVAEIYRKPFENMTIRLFCKYFRIGHEAYDRYFMKLDPDRKPRTIKDDVPEELRDIAYYDMVKLGGLKGNYDLDSQEDFEKFAHDHYGELGLSRLNIGASNYDSPGWMITVSNSYSSHVDVAIDVATALYKAGAPLKIYSADKLLKILKEEDYVKLIPDTYHDYMNHHEEGTVFQLPWEYECDGGDEAYFTVEQYKEIVDLAQWEEEAKVKLV